MNAAHTPGPWYALPGQHNISIRHKTGDKNLPMLNVASVRGRFGPDCPHGQSEANARLIVAAPELLDALQHIYGVALADEPRDLKGIAMTARLAIAKATGSAE